MRTHRALHALKEVEDTRIRHQIPQPFNSGSPLAPHPLYWLDCPVCLIQSHYGKKAYDTWVAEASKLGEMYAAIARDAYKPVDKAVAKRTS